MARTNTPITAPTSNENADPYLQLLEEWEEDKRMLERYKVREAEKRGLLFAGAFPKPKEGSNKHVLPDGRTVQADHKINRSIDEAALAPILEKLKEDGVANADVLVRYKPELNKREWNTLSPAHMKTFSKAVVARVGTPSLKIIPKKGD